MDNDTLQELTRLEKDISRLNRELETVYEEIDRQKNAAPDGNWRDEQSYNAGFDDGYAAGWKAALQDAAKKLAALGEKGFLPEDPEEEF